MPGQLDSELKLIQLIENILYYLYWYDFVPRRNDPIQGLTRIHDGIKRNQ